LAHFLLQCTNFLGPLVSKINRPENTMSLDLYILSLCIIQFVYVRCIMGRMYQSGEILFLERYILWTRGPNSFGDTSFRDVPSPHRKLLLLKPSVPFWTLHKGKSLKNRGGKRTDDSADRNNSIQLDKRVRRQ